MKLQNVIKLQNGVEVGKRSKVTRGEGKSLYAHDMMTGRVMTFKSRWRRGSRLQVGGTKTDVELSKFVLGRAAVSVNFPCSNNKFEVRVVCGYNTEYG